MADPIAVTETLVMLPIGKIKPYHRNPRKNEATVAKLVELIPKVGFNVPLVLDRKNVIVKGHTRWKAAIRLAMKQLPVVYTDADPETIKLDRLADNRVQEFSTWDEELLQSEIGSLNLPFKFDLGSLNFDVGDVSFGNPAEAEIVTAAATPLNGNGAEAGAADAGRREPGEEPEEEPEEETATPFDGPPITTPEYLEVTCNKCGNHLFVKKE